MLWSRHAWLPPLFAEGHARGIQVGILHGLHLRAAQEIIKGVEGVWWPGHRLLMTGMAGRAQSGAHWAQALHVMHCSGHQVAWNKGNMKTNIIIFSDHWFQWWLKDILCDNWNFPELKSLPHYSPCTSAANLQLAVSLSVRRTRRSI